LARSWILDLKEREIRVDVVGPGIVDTPGTDGLLPDAVTAATISSQIPLGRIAQPENIALAALFLASEDATFVNGVDLAVDGGYSQV
jgi:NAD(P)-dependent dehydrogenase (short-subunit alcohol dehydrogenase family)